eukprot:scaffold26190_cov119-Isochrysis_galbana.AAC.1
MPERWVLGRASHRAAIGGRELVSDGGRHAEIGWHPCRARGQGAVAQTRGAPSLQFGAARSLSTHAAFASPARPHVHCADALDADSPVNIRVINEASKPGSNDATRQKREVDLAVIGMLITGMLALYAAEQSAVPASGKQNGWGGPQYQ